MYYAHINEDGLLLGWYTPLIHKEIPEPNIKCSEEVWQNAIDNLTNVYNLKTKKFEFRDLRTHEEVESDYRSIRNSILQDLDELVMNPFRFLELSEDQKQELKEYRLLLLDVPQQSGFPENIEWPIVPKILEEHIDINTLNDSEELEDLNG